jgi:hypothetical protein
MEERLALRITLDSFLLYNDYTILKTTVYKITLQWVILYGCETWSLTLTKECRLRALENTVLNNIFGSHRNEVILKWISEMWDERACTGLIWLRIGTGVGLL